MPAPLLHEVYQIFPPAEVGHGCGLKQGIWNTGVSLFSLLVVFLPGESPSLDSFFGVLNMH